jgi:hypothetical protein
MSSDLPQKMIRIFRMMTDIRDYDYWELGNCLARKPFLDSQFQDYIELGLRTVQIAQHNLYS